MLLVLDIAGLFTHQLASLRAMIRAENNTTAFGALRGGILGDAPGLGKTITMLALVANTAGRRPVEPREFYDDESIDEHWKRMRTNPMFREAILKAMRPLRDAHLYESLALEVSPPYKDDRFPTLPSFVQHVNRSMRRAVPQSQLDLFRRNVIAFKAGLDKRNRRFFSNEKGRRLVLERNLIPCSTTLIIVPDALLEHWAEQIRRHVNLAVFSDFGGSHGVVYIDGVGDLADARFPLNHSKMPLPSAFDLLSYVMVVVPFSRIRQHFVHARKRKQEDSYAKSYGAASHASSSPLLQLRWFRITVDEGHELGENATGSDVTQFINEMGAERRWVLSGTPTTGDEDSAGFTAKGLDQLQRLLFFLRHESYGTVPDSAERKRGQSKKEHAKSAWEAQVKKPFLRKQEEGRKELYRVLDEVMVMHKKEDIGLPRPVFKQSEVAVPIPSHVQSDIIEAVKSEDRNDASALHSIGIQNKDRTILPCAPHAGGKTLFKKLVSDYLGTDSFQTLVDEYQAKFIVDRIRRERLELKRRGGAILERVTAPITAATDPGRCAERKADRRPTKVVVYSNSHNNLLSVAEYLYESFDNESIAEMMEGRIDHMAYEMSRFRNGVMEGKNCPICGGWNEYTGRNLVSCRNRLVEVCDSENNTYIIEPERIKRAVGVQEYDSKRIAAGAPVATSRLQGAPLTKYGQSQKYWRVNDVLAVDARDPHPLLQKRWGEDTWAAYGSQRCVALAASDGHEGKDNYLGCLPAPKDGNGDGREVIVRLKKWQPCGRFHSRPRWDALRKKNVGWYTGPALADVALRAQKEDTVILLLDASLAHGLDLSFVTHMFLLEPIDDAALLEQVTARAHRLGCTGPVTIETVHMWHELDPATKEFTKQLKATDEDEDRKKTSTAVCEHCYRSFDTLKLAELHELTCPRNPHGNAIVDPCHLSSVYRAIRPPPPMSLGLPGTLKVEGASDEMT